MNEIAVGDRLYHRVTNEQVTVVEVWPDKAKLKYGDGRLYRTVSLVALRKLYRP